MVYDKIEDVVFQFGDFNIKIVVNTTYTDGGMNKKSCIVERKRPTAKYVNSSTDNALTFYAPSIGIVFEKKNFANIADAQSLYIGMFNFDYLVELVKQFKVILNSGKVFKYEQEIAVDVFAEHRNPVEIGPFKYGSIFFQPGISEGNKEIINIVFPNGARSGIPLDMFYGMCYWLERLDLYNASRNMMNMALNIERINAVSFDNANPRKQ